MNILTLLMAPQQPGQGNPIMSFLPILLIIVVFYFFMIRPQSKKAKNERIFKENLKKGDKIITNGGIHGKIIEMADSNVTIECEGNIRLKVEKWAISMESTMQLQNQQQ